MSDIGDLVSMGFILNEDHELVLTKDTYADNDVLVLGDCYVGDALDTTGDVSCGGDIIQEEESSSYYSAILSDIDTAGNRIHFTMPFGGYVKGIYAVLWADTGTGAASIRTEIDGVLFSQFDMLFSSASEGAVDSAEIGLKDSSRFVVDDIVTVYISSSTVPNDGVTVGIVLDAVRTQR